MGWVFDIEHANLVGYLTTDPPRGDAPRATSRVLLRFLENLSTGVRENAPIISSDPKWLDDIRLSADRSRSILLSLQASVEKELGAPAAFERELAPRCSCGSIAATPIVCRLLSLWAYPF